MGNCPPQSPEGRQTASDEPFNPWPAGQENAALPPTSRDNIATRGAVPFAINEGFNGTSPHSTPKIR